MTEIRKFAKQFFGFAEIGLSRLFGGSEPAKLVSTSVGLDFCPPAPGVILEMNAFVRRAASLDAKAVRTILRLITRPKIGPPVVQAISIYVVRRKALWRSDYQPVHVNKPLPRTRRILAITTHISRGLSWVKMPLVRADQFFIGIVEKYNATLDDNLSHAQDALPDFTSQ